MSRSPLLGKFSQSSKGPFPFLPSRFPYLWTSSLLSSSNRLESSPPRLVFPVPPSSSQVNSLLPKLNNRACPCYIRKTYRLSDSLCPSVRLSVCLYPLHSTLNPSLLPCQPQPRSTLNSIHSSAQLRSIDPSSPSQAWPPPLPLSRVHAHYSNMPLAPGLSMLCMYVTALRQ
ncbi:hypothetical protein Mapa_010318 [Marchantia paleacea]|nr:hypothetical protein Mapa_010318 [Marchantia paleacea]